MFNKSYKCMEFYIFEFSACGMLQFLDTILCILEMLALWGLNFDFLETSLQMLGISYIPEGHK